VRRAPDIGYVLHIIGRWRHKSQSELGTSTYPLKLSEMKALRRRVERLSRTAGTLTVRLAPTLAGRHVSLGQLKVMAIRPAAGLSRLGPVGAILRSEKTPQVCGRRSLRGKLGAS
jgi:hypothetical protein